MTNAIQVQTDLDRAFLVFCTAWIIWGASTHFFLYRNRPVAFRRVWHMRVALISAAAFLGFLFYIVHVGFPAKVLTVFVPALFLMTFLNIRNTRFCDACGKQTFSMKLFQRPQRCRRCQVSFD